MEGIQGVSTLLPLPSAPNTVTDVDDVHLLFKLFDVLQRSGYRGPGSCIPHLVDSY